MKDILVISMTCFFIFAILLIVIAYAPLVKDLFKFLVKKIKEKLHK